MKRPQTITAAVLLCAGLHAPPARAQEPAAPPGPLRVRVTGGPDGGPRTPVAGVPVVVGGRMATTDDDGRAVFDGIPRGRYAVEVWADGYETLRRPIELAVGLREPLGLELRGAPFVRFGGRVVAEAPAAPLPGAVVRLRPRECPAAIEGPAECVTDWEGAFRVDYALTAGVYDLEVSAAGAETVRQSVTLREGEENTVEIALPRRVERDSASVRVTDVGTGGAVRGARVTLAEAWPAGVVASGTTDEQGACRFADLALGALNTTAETLPATRRDLTVAVEAEGFAPAVLPLRLGDRTALPVRLHRIAEQPELEPNGALTIATPIYTDAPVRLAITANDDVDLFRFELPQPAQVTVELGPVITVDAALAVLNSDGADIWRIRPAPQGPDAQPATGTLQLAAGRYFVAVHSWYQNQCNEQPMQLRVRTEWAVDAFEPNGAAASARLVAANETLRGRIFPVGDEDLFRFVMTRPGRVRATSPAYPLDRRLRIARLNGDVLADIRTGGAGVAEAQLEPGEYLFWTGVWYNNVAATTPYEVTLSVIEDDGVDDATPAAGPPRPVRTLAVGTSVASTTFPVGDEDWYSVTVPGRGLLHVALFPSAADGRLAVHDRSGGLLADVRMPAGQEGRSVLEFDGPAQALVRVGAWYNNLDATGPYALRAWFTPTDEFDWQARNDTSETAMPAEFFETLRGTILPTGDQDHYGFTVDHPGRVRLRVMSPLDTGLTIRDAAGTMLGEWRFTTPTEETNFDVPVLPGGYVVGVRIWYNNGRSTAQYALRVELLRADAVERVPVANDPPRVLRPGVAEPFAIEHVGDWDRFLFETADAEPIFLRILSPVDSRVRVTDDRTGAVVREERLTGAWSGQWTPEGPARYRIEMAVWYDNTWSLDSGWLMVDDQQRAIPLSRVTAQPDLQNPRQVTFLVAPVEGAGDAVRGRLDADGDGRDDLAVSLGVPAVFTYAQEGDYAYRLEVDGLDGTTAVTRGWVHAAGPRAREGVVVSLARPVEGEVLETLSPVTARALSYSADRVTAVAFAVDDRPVATVFSSPYTAELPWRELGAGPHTLTVTARDAAGNQAALTRRFSVSPYLNLLPHEGAVLSGNEVRVSWTAHEFGPATVRVRPQGQTEWAEHVGENARDRVVVLRGLEAGQPYEFQPVGGDDPGPVRTFTRVKGLAFTQPQFGATIARDYDQRLAIGVMNSGDAPLQVRLECAPPPDPRLLVGFVGEGSEDRPIPLGPGERREFLLGISAQDVVTAQHRFAIRLTSDAGLTDEAWVEVNVRLPVVNFEWQDVGPIASGMGHAYRLRNAGDTITDLALYSDRADVSVSPAVSHGLIPAGATLDVSVYPLLHEGFQRVEARVIARGLDKEVAVPFVAALELGESIHRVILRPGADPQSEPDPVETTVAEARLLAADYLLPEDADWGSAEPVGDLDGDGLPDRWSVRDTEGDILWVGDDTDGDQAIDFIHADLGMDDSFEYSAYRLASGEWQRTNLVEAWLEMGFSLPWSRESYQTHEVDVVLNDTVIGRLRDAVPEGNYTFRIPPAALRFGASGRPEDNRVAIRSRHLRGGHYVVNSDFRFRLRLTETPVWSAGRTPAEARERAAQVEGLRLSGTDFSLSAARIRLAGPNPPPADSDTWFEVPVRNLGAARPNRLELALLCGPPGAEATEAARVRVEPVPLTGETVVRVPWRVPAGVSALRFVIDPDGRTSDTDRRNNVAPMTIQAAGAAPPGEVTVNEPAAGAEIAGPAVTLRATGAPSLELSIDGALWQPLPPGEARLILQPGEHVLAVRAAGVGEGTRVPVRVTGAAPAPVVERPAAGEEIASRRAEVSIRCPPDTVLAGIRANGGPWVKATIAGEMATAELPLRFGDQTIDVMTVSSRGMVGIASVAVRCTVQPAANEPEVALPASPPGNVTVLGAGTMDFFTQQSGVARP